MNINTDEHLAKGVERMNSSGLEKAQDEFYDQRMDLLYEYFEDEKCFREFADNWLWENKQTEVREALFQHFLDNCRKDKRYLDFEGWAIDKLTDDERGG